MEELKRYSVTNDITSQEVKLKILRAEIISGGCVTDFASLSLEGDDVVIWGGSINNESELDDILLNHEACPLADHKLDRHYEIDTKTQQLMKEGFTYDSNEFSLSNLSQGNYDALKNNTDYYTWPKYVSTKDNGAYSLTEANVGAFWNAYKDAVEGHISTGRALNLSIKNAVDKAAVDAIVDNR